MPPNRNPTEPCRIGDVYYAKSGDAWHCVQANVWQAGATVTPVPWAEQVYTFELNNVEVGALLVFALAFAGFLGKLLGERKREARDGH